MCLNEISYANRGDQLAAEVHCMLFCQNQSSEKQSARQKQRSEKKERRNCIRWSRWERKQSDKEATARDQFPRIRSYDVNLSSFLFFLKVSNEQTWEKKVKGINR